MMRPLLRVILPSHPIFALLLFFFSFVSGITREVVAEDVSSHLAQLEPRRELQAHEHGSILAQNALEARVGPAINEDLVERQNYYAFSGAVYIVEGNGQQLNAASPAYCPAQAPQGCGNIGVWNWFVHTQLRRASIRSDCFKSLGAAPADAHVLGLIQPEPTLAAVPLARLASKEV